jgi:tyrosine-protein kinase Etk/Wzc
MRGIYRSRWVVAGITLGVVLLGAVATWTQTPEYEAEATLRLPEGGGASGLLGSLTGVSGLGALSGVGAGSIQTEIVVLKSRAIAEAVVDSLALRVRLLEPEVPRDQILDVVSAPHDSAGGVFELVLNDDGRYSVRVEGSSAPARPAEVVPGTVLHLAGTTVRLRATSGGAAPERIRIQVLPFRSAVGTLQRNLSVDQVESGTQVLSVRASDPDRVLAAGISNGVAAEYIRYKSNTGTSSAASSVRFLQEQVDRYATQLAAAEEQLQRFNETEGIVNLDAQTAAQVRQLADVQAQRDMMLTEREALRSILARADAAPRSDTAPSPYRRLATFPTFLSNGIIQNLERTMTELETDRSQLLGRFTPDHPDVRQINERIREIESQLHRIATNYVESLNSELGSLDTTLSRFRGAASAAPARQMDYARLVRRQQMLQDGYALFETPLKEAQIHEAGEPVNVQVLDPALVPGRPASPRPLLALALSAVVGLILGTGIAFVRTLLDPKVRNRSDDALAAGGAPVIGVIPRLWIEPGRSRVRRLGRPNGKTRATLADPSAPTDPHLVAYHDPSSPAAEAFRGLRTSITLPDPDRSPQVIVTTSAMPGEGKSVSASNLAVTLAQQQTRTLLIDADLRQGSLDRVFGLTREPGLSDVLRGRATLEEVVHEVSIQPQGSPLHVLTAGAPPPNPSELLGSEAMRRLIEAVRDTYGMIVLDAPPLHLVTDAAVLGTLADHTLLIARAGTTHKRALAEAAGELQRLGVPLAGVVVNDIDQSDVPYYRYGYGVAGVG